MVVDVVFIVVVLAVVVLRVKVATSLFSMWSTFPEDIAFDS